MDGHRPRRIEHTIARTTATKYGLHHEHASLPRNDGGTEYINIKNIHYRKLADLQAYLNTRRDHPLYNTIIRADKSITPLNLCNIR